MTRRTRKPPPGPNALIGDAAFYAALLQRVDDIGDALSRIRAMREVIPDRPLWPGKGKTREKKNER